MTAAAGGFRALRVVARRAESSSICSFLLQPVQPQHWQAFEAGQYLSFRLPGTDASTGPLLRHYSVSSSPLEAGCYRISVKHKAGRPPELPEGLGSGWLHGQVQVGDTLQASGPHGVFRLDRHSDRPVLLLSAGVGLTPMVSMLHVLAASSRRPTWFLHACDHGGVHAFRDEVQRLAAQRDGIQVVTCYRWPSADDRAAGRCQAEGLIDRAHLQRWLPLDNYEVYLCGPPPFMQAQFALLRSLGVPRERIAHEFFGPASLLVEPGAASPAVRAAPPVAPVPPEALPPAGMVRVRFSASGRVADWQLQDGSLLATAERCGLTPPFSCRAGVCGSCECDLVEGEVDYFEEPLDPPGPGRVLPCCARPRGDVTLAL